MENSSSRTTWSRYPAARVIKRSQSPNLFVNKMDNRVSSVSSPPNLPPLTPINTIKINTKNRNSVAADKAIEMAKLRRAKSVTNNPPSAWALSPGRSTPPPSSPALAVLLKSGNNTSEPASRNKVVTKSSSYGSSCSTNTDGGGRCGSTGGVFRYFRSKNKVPCGAKEEASHGLRIFHTRLVQWRLVNGCAEMLMAKRNSIAVMKLLSVWSRIYQMRKLMVEKRIQVQKLRQEVKLLQIINPELNLLSKWSKIEKKNSEEALTNLAGNLSSLSIRVPLVNGAKVDMVSLYKTLRTTVNLMNSIEETVERSFLEVKETSLLPDQLKDTIRQETKSFEELRNALATLSSLEIF